MSVTFHRPPREWPAPGRRDRVLIKPPPVDPVPMHQSRITALSPLIGGVPLVGFALVLGNRTFLIIGLLVLVLLLGYSLVLPWAQKRAARKRAADEAARYTGYFHKLDDELLQDGEVQSAALARLYPGPNAAYPMAHHRRHLWERRRGDDDFLRVRVGIGSVPLDRPVAIDLDPLAAYQRPSWQEAQLLFGRRRVPRAPVTFDLAETGVLTVCGAREETRGWARWLMIQLAQFRAPQDLQIVTSFSPADEEDWAWGARLAHQRLDAGAGVSVLAQARTPGDLDKLLEPELGRRAEHLRRLDEIGGAAREAGLVAPELVVIVDGYTPDDPVNVLSSFRTLREDARRHKAVLVLLVETREDEPSEIDARITLPRRGGASLVYADPDRPPLTGIAPDHLDAGMGQTFAEMLGGIVLHEAGGQEHRLDSEVRLSRLLDGARTIRSRAEALRTPIGVGADGREVVLDLKQLTEGGNGPHGMLVGATGSGKSELMRSLVAGLAATHPPDVLAFVMADFKGGSGFAPLARLPHVAGLITNLEDDLSLVDRMREAIEGEIDRRQTVLHTAGAQDVLAYRELRDRDPSLDPLPDLLVIVDEFAELLIARPEFLDLFVRIGQVGRSLGLHLLLAAQRLETGRLRGLESHLRYRICLRTNNDIESKMVLGTPDAYVLPNVSGLGYLKVDTTVYRQFRGGFAAAPRGGGRTELDELVERLAAEDVEPARQIWAPPLPTALPLDAVGDEIGGELVAVVGLVDRPQQQRVDPLAIDLASAGGNVAVVGAPQSGKSTLLRSLALSLVTRYTPDEVRLYGIDLGSGQLSALEAAPHVGGVATGRRPEAIARVVRQLETELEERADRFDRLGLESVADARAAREGSDGELADIVLMVDGWGAFRSRFEELERDVIQLASSGAALGLHVVIAANRWADVRSAMLEVLGHRLELRLNEPATSEHGRKVAETLPVDVPGRGFVRSGLLFQSALPRFDGRADDHGLGDAVTATSRALAERWTGAAAEPIRVLPATVAPERLPDPTPAALPLGLHERTLGPVALDLVGADPHLVVFGDPGSGKSSVLRLVASGVSQAFSPEQARLVVIDPRRALVDVAETPHLHRYAMTAPGAEDAALELAEVLGPRVPGAVSGPAPLGAETLEGPRYIVLCDDYDLLATPNASPLVPLLDLLSVGRDIGLHVVLARRVSNTARSTFEPFFGRLRDLGAPGLILDGHPADGPLIDGHKARRQPKGRGLLVRYGQRPLTIQTAFVQPDDGETRQGRIA